MGRLLSVNVGLPRDVKWQGRTVHTGIWKDPVPGEIALTIALEIEAPRLAAAGYRILPDPGMHSAALPLDVARKPNVH